MRRAARNPRSARARAKNRSTQAIARSTSRRATSRCVHQRWRVVPVMDAVARRDARRTPRRWPRGTATNTMFVCAGDTASAACRASPAASRAAFSWSSASRAMLCAMRIAPGRGEDSRLPHAAAQHLAPAPRGPDEVAPAAQHRADRRAEPLRQAHRHRIEALRDRPRRHALLHRGVPQPRAVEVQREPCAVGELARRRPRSPRAAPGRRSCSRARSAASARSASRRA